MRVYTCQIAARHKAVGTALDITVKSGTGLGKLLAPTWEIVMDVKRNRISPERYIQVYLALLRERYRQNKEAFLQILAMDEVCLCCFCPKGAFCHRHLAVEVLEKIAAYHGIPFERGGELSA